MRWFIVWLVVFIAVWLYTDSAITGLVAACALGGWWLDRAPESETSTSREPRF